MSSRGKRVRIKGRATASTGQGAVKAVTRGASTGDDGTVDVLFGGCGISGVARCRESVWRRGWS